jgi:hypothetical protein
MTLYLLYIVYLSLVVVNLLEYIFFMASCFGMNVNYKNDTTSKQDDQAMCSTLNDDNMNTLSLQQSIPTYPLVRAAFLCIRRYTATAATGAHVLGQGQLLQQCDITNVQLGHHHFDTQ